MLEKLDAAKLNDPNIDDATFLRRLCLDVRGTLPTPVEMWFFVSDADDDKRAKVVDWMADDEAAKAGWRRNSACPRNESAWCGCGSSGDGKSAWCCFG